MEAKMFSQQLQAAFQKAGDLNDADPHPFNSAVNDFCSMRDTENFIFKIESVFADDIEAFVRFGDSTILWFRHNGEIRAYEESI